MDDKESLTGLRKILSSRWFRIYMIFIAVMGTAMMFSPIADRMPGGRVVGWVMAGISWLLVYILCSAASSSCEDQKTH